ncbi:globin family protein [Denitrobaculum tricleocarpae]|uniref:Hemin receptor n=1 Tax=Denitrobaculum tricleocarpae TaxID=2591009 RepID=A0A545TX62_9PROT|nr:globin family protein [Denitrobaculum tricleocarpae]TQV81802.1 hemin receptor [Denitrobaculum tricleocarpae]
MSPRQIEIIRRTWKQLAPNSDDAAKLFYRRLFQIDPSTKPLFASVDMPAQRKKLMQTLGSAVIGLQDLDALVPIIEDMGRRHADYGVTDAHYDSVGEALLWTLKQGLGEDWNDDVQEAWTRIYRLIADTMRSAAREAAA